MCAYSTLFALRAKALQSGAPDMGVSRKKQFHKRFAHQGGVGAPGNAKPFPHLFRGSVFPMPSRGETGGLCPHPPKGPIPWESLFGDRPRLSPSPVPQNAAGGKPLLVGLPPSAPSPAPQET